MLELPENVVDYMLEGNSREDLVVLYWSKLTEDEKKSLIAEAEESERVWQQ